MRLVLVDDKGMMFPVTENITKFDLKSSSDARRLEEQIVHVFEEAQNKSFPSGTKSLPKGDPK